MAASSLPTWLDGSQDTKEPLGSLHLLGGQAHRQGEIYDDCTRHTPQDITLGGYMSSPLILWLPVSLTVNLIMPNL